MKRVLALVTAGLIGYGIAKLADIKQVEATDKYIEVDTKENQPMFYVGDRLHLFNPHTGELFYDFDSFGPTLYTVKDVDYDAEDETFRYLLDFDVGFDYIAIGANGEEVEEIWVAEEWLSLPFYPEFSRTRIEVPVQEVTQEYIEAERKILGKVLDDFAKQTQIDTILDKLSWAMNYGTDEEVSEYKRQLRTITEGGD